MNGIGFRFWSRIVGLENGSRLLVLDLELELGLWVLGVETGSGIAVGGLVARLFVESSVSVESVTIFCQPTVKWQRRRWPQLLLSVGAISWDIICAGSRMRLIDRIGAIGCDSLILIPRVLAFQR